MILCNMLAVEAFVDQLHEISLYKPGVLLCCQHNKAVMSEIMLKISCTNILIKYPVNYLAYVASESSIVNVEGGVDIPCINTSGGFNG